VRVYLRVTFRLRVHPDSAAHTRKLNFGPHCGFASTTCLIVSVFFVWRWRGLIITKSGALKSAFLNFLKNITKYFLTPTKNNRRGWMRSRGEGLHFYAQKRMRR